MVKNADNLDRRMDLTNRKKLLTLISLNQPKTKFYVLFYSNFISNKTRDSFGCANDFQR